MKTISYDRYNSYSVLFLTLQRHPEFLINPRVDEKVSEVVGEDDVGDVVRDSNAGQNDHCVRSVTRNRDQKQTQPDLHGFNVAGVLRAKTIFECIKFCLKRYKTDIIFGLAIF